jgi:hypothetical protein
MVKKAVLTKKGNAERVDTVYKITPDRNSV